MSDRDRLLALLRERGSRGASTLEIRRMGLSGNPSQRRAELIDRGFQIDVEPYREGRRRGRRYILVSGPRERAALGAQKHSGSPTGERLPPPETPRQGSRTDEGLFDANQFKPRRQHDQVESA